MVKKIKDKLKRNKTIYKCVKKIKYALIYFIDVNGKVFFFNVQYVLRRLHILRSDTFVESLKDKYKGEKIFVVATGPSLSIDMINRLYEEEVITISVNGIFKIFDKTNWRPDYYVMDDYWTVKKYIRDYPSMRLDKIGKKGTIFAEKCKEMIPYVDDMKDTGYVPVCYFDHWWTHRSKHFKYNREIIYGNFDFYTVTNFAINLADYMGAAEVYLLGVDCDYTSAVMHVGEEQIRLTEKNMKDNIETEYGMLNGYQMINRLIGNNIKIYNINKGGKVNTLEEALNK